MDPWGNDISHCKLKECKFCQSNQAISNISTTLSFKNLSFHDVFKLWGNNFSTYRLTEYDLPMFRSYETIISVWNPKNQSIASAENWKNNTVFIYQANRHSFLSLYNILMVHCIYFTYWRIPCFPNFQLILQDKNIKHFNLW